MLVRFMYTGQIRLNKDVVKKIIIMADYYGVEILKETSGEWVGKTLLDVNNVCEHIVFASKHNIHSLYKLCYRFMLGNAKDIFFSNEFRTQISYEILDKMAQSDDLNLTELELFQSLILWGESRAEISPTCRSALSHNLSEHISDISLSDSDDDHVRQMSAKEASAPPETCVSPESALALR